MESMKLEPGCWVLALSLVDETLPNGAHVVHAKPGAVGHVLEVGPETAVIYWERTGTMADCLFEELEYMCSSDGIERVDTN